MSSKPTSQPPKRARTSVKGPQDVAEEWAQVNSLIERRRLQNRLSQKNYRNKIRARLEKLESLLDANANGQAQTPEAQCIKEAATISPQPDSTKPSAQTESADVWVSMSEYINFSKDANFENHAQNSRLSHDHNGDYPDEFQAENEYPSPDPSFGYPTSPSFIVAEANDVCSAPISPPSDPTSRSSLEAESIDPHFSPSLDPQPANASATPDLSSYPHFSGYPEPHSTTSANSLLFPAMSPLLSYSATSSSTGCEGTTVNPINVFPSSPYQPLATATTYPSDQQHQQHLQYVWIPFLVPMLSNVTPPPQPCLARIPTATVSAGRQK